MDKLHGKKPRNSQIMQPMIHVFLVIGKKKKSMHMFLEGIYRIFYSTHQHNTRVEDKPEEAFPSKGHGVY